MSLNEPDSAARANASLECGQLVGSLNVLLKRSNEIQIIALYCTEPPHHHDACKFVGKELIVTRRR